MDPSTRTLEVYRREGDFWVRIGIWEDDEKAQAEPFDAVALDLSTWWETLELGKEE